MTKYYFLLFLFVCHSCNKIENKSTNFYNSDLVVVSEPKQYDEDRKIINILKKTKLEMLSRDSLIEIKTLNNFIHSNLLPIRDKSDVDFNYVEWAHKNDYLRIFTFKFKSNSSLMMAKSKMSEICANSSTQKDRLKKMFRSYKFSNDTLQLYKHNFFSHTKKKEYQELVNYLELNFDCW